MAYTARSRRTTTVLAALSLGIAALTACDSEAEKDKAAPNTAASPSTRGTDKGSDSGTDKGSDAPSTARPGGAGRTGGGSSGNGGSTPPASQPASDDDQDGGVGMCETSDLSYTVTVASKPDGHALLTATNKGADPCLLPANELVITVPGLDGTAEHGDPKGTDWILKSGESAYAGIMFSSGDAAGGKSIDKVEVALTAAEAPATVPINDGPVTFNDSRVTTFFATAEDALTY